MCTIPYTIYTAASPLHTAEEARNFLISMRKAQKDGSGISHKPPSNLSADGMDAWYLQQKQREQELRQRRKEAEEMLRGYRMSATGMIMGRSGTMRCFGSPMSAVSETLDDPDCLSVYDSNNNNHGPSRRHTIHAGDRHFQRGLESEFENEKSSSNNNNYNQQPQQYKLETPVNNVSFANAFEEAQAVEEKKSEHEPGSVYRSRHSTAEGRPLGETPLPIDEQHAGRGVLPETIWRDFISSGTYRRIFLFCMVLLPYLCGV